MTTSAPSSIRVDDGDDLWALVGRAALCTGGLGLALGLWCRAFVDGAAGAAGETLGQLGSPWVLVAFAAGALVASPRSGDPVLALVAVALGGLTGAGAMVVASFSYYGDASSPSAVFWATVGLLVGGAAGVAGAAWRTWPGGAVEAVAAGGLGLVFVAEGLGRLDHGWFHAVGHLVGARTGWLVLAGIATPILLTRGRPAGVVASCAVVLLAVPVAGAVVVASSLGGLA